MLIGVNQPWRLAIWCSAVSRACGGVYMDGHGTSNLNKARSRSASKPPAGSGFIGARRLALMSSGGRRKGMDPHPRCSLKSGMQIAARTRMQGVDHAPSSGPGCNRDAGRSPAGSVQASMFVSDCAADSKLLISAVLEGGLVGFRRILELRRKGHAGPAVVPS